MSDTNNLTKHDLPEEHRLRVVDRAPLGFKAVTLPYLKAEKWMLLNVIQDFTGSGFGQRGKKDSVEFVLVPEKLGEKVERFGLTPFRRISEIKVAV
jgi:hypothetical protein